MFSGIAPGYKKSLRWWKLGLSSEGEYVFDTRDSSGSFFYNWSELDPRAGGVVSIRPRDATHRGYQTDRDIQRGLLAGFSFKRVDFTTYVFNPDDKPTVVLAMSVNF